ncbi:MAG: ATP-binding protein [Clostridiales bacterium]|nr:ATP-binding protein [Clostridiales bacterium]
MINKFSCKNFRNIKADNLEFEKINILIGPNNSGKSNFIKALNFFSEMLKSADEGNLKSAFLNAVARNGWEHSLYKHAEETSPIEFSWDIDLNGEPVRYKISFGVGNSVEKCNIVLEELSSSDQKEGYEKEFNYFRCHDYKIGVGNFSTAIKKGQSNRRLSFEMDSKETLVMQFKDILLKNKRIYGNELIRVNIAKILYDLQKYFEGFNVYTSAQFETKKMREPVNVKNIDDLLSQDASNFVNVFNRYKSENILWKNLFESRMKELIPDLQVADTVIAYDKLIFKLVYNDEQYDLSDVSEGTLKGLVLNMLINMPMNSERSLLAIDEPETNLHPAWQKVVGNWIQTADTFDQCFISTHSPDFLDVFTEEFKNENVAVFVFGNDLCIKKIKYENIIDELGEWELGDLYRTNDPALGGWPW